MLAKLIDGPFDATEREVEDPPPDVVLCTDAENPTLEHLYRLRGVEAERAVYAYAPEAAHAGP